LRTGGETPKIELWSNPPRKRDRGSEREKGIPVSIGGASIELADGTILTGEKLNPYAFPRGLGSNSIKVLAKIPRYLHLLP